MGIVGRPAPHFSGEAAKDGEILHVSLSDYKGRWLVLFFYPLDFTFVCPTELVALSDRYGAFQGLDTEILGVSVDSVHTHLAWMRAPRTEAGVGDLAFPLLSDLSKKIAEAYDVLHGDRALRGVFLIDPDGNVQAATVHTLPVGRNVDEILRLIAAYQHVRKRGGTCPVDWRAGDEGMAGTLDGVKRFLGSVKAVELTDGSFAASIAAAPRAIVDFHAPWCGPCVLFKPTFRRLAEANPHVAFFLVDCEQAPAARATVRFRDLPYLAIYRSGALLEGLCTVREEEVRALVERHFGAAP